MFNTVIVIQRAMTCYGPDNASEKRLSIVKEMLDTVGTSKKTQEHLMPIATALCACGIVFSYVPFEPFCKAV
jgi:pyrroline-5-carboxylate reductase